MSFHSFAFILVFLPLVVAGYFALGRLGRPALPKLWLLAASLVFYAAGRIADLPLLLGSLAANGALAAYLVRSQSQAGSRRRALLAAGVTANILFLCAFKYAAFFVDLFNRLAGTAFAAPHIAFPLGISFFTIQQIMFLVDCYEGLVEGHNWLDYSLFGGFFAYVTMGPIVRWKQVAAQWNSPLASRASADNIANGLFVFVLGLFKKVVLADSFFRWADAGFAYAHPLSLAGGWIAALAFTFQLYFDFSGYTDMAIGAALMLNIKLPQNFNSPFHALNIGDFWRRWHITLTNFITTYLYTPMLRSMKEVTFARALLATFTAMTIAGFWHGANWTYIAFGALHGAALAVHQCWRKLKRPLPAPLAWLLTFAFVVVALVFFRSANMHQALQVVQSMFGFHGGLFSYEPWSGIDRIDQAMGIGWMLCGAAILLRAPNSLELQRRFAPSWAALAISVGLAGISFVYANSVVSRSFVYRDF
jgi:D-alanyl-lipoteichoic acid acyltransferase DltB (MBOAT superfamily)